MLQDLVWFCHYICVDILLGLNLIMQARGHQFRLFKNIIIVLLKAKGPEVHLYIAYNAYSRARMSGMHLSIHLLCESVAKCVNFRVNVAFCLQHC